MNDYQLYILVAAIMSTHNHKAISSIWMLVLAGFILFYQFGGVK